VVPHEVVVHEVQVAVPTAAVPTAAVQTVNLVEVLEGRMGEMRAGGMGGEERVVEEGG
jgi:hypothetical protein